MLGNHLTTRRKLLGAATIGLASPYLLSSNLVAPDAYAQDSVSTRESYSVNKIQLGAMKIAIVSDGGTIQNRPWETFGTDRPPEEVKTLLQQNFLPTEQFVLSYAPIIIDTGTEVILVDTGFGEDGRSNGAGKMLGALQAAGYSLDEITMVFLTHLHRDHIGGLREAVAKHSPKPDRLLMRLSMISGFPMREWAQLQKATISRCWSA